MHQVFLNLCVNARDAMPRGGGPTLSAENLILDAEYVRLNPDARPGPHVVFRLRIPAGIPTELSIKSSILFSQPKTQARALVSGCRPFLGIVKSHQGSLQVQSRLGYGTQI